MPFIIIAAFILLFILYLFLSCVGNLFFSYKVHLLTEKKYLQAGIFGAIAVFFNASMIGFSAFISIFYDSWYLIVIFSTFIFVGNYFSGLLIPSFDKLMNRIFGKKEDKKDFE